MPPSCLPPGSPADIENASTNKKRAVGTRPFGREPRIICQMRYETGVSTRLRIRFGHLRAPPDHREKHRAERQGGRGDQQGHRERSGALRQRRREQRPEDLADAIGGGRIADQARRRVAAQAARIPHREKRDGGERHAQQQAAQREAADRRPGHRQHDAERLQRVGRRPAAAGCPNAWARGRRSARRARSARPNSGQKRSGQGEPGSAWRAITGRKVAVMM